MAAIPRMVRVICFFTVVCAALGPVGAAGSTSSTLPPIGPKQHFVGLVNGKHKGVLIYVACPGPVGGTGTAAPVGNQTVSVRQVVSGGGDTGPFAHKIWVEFGKDAMHVVGFARYNVSKPIPTSLRLPCQGTVTVTFTTCFGTLPCAVGAEDDHVTATIANLAV